MPAVRIKLDDLPRSVLFLGFVGENDSRSIEIDCDTVYKEFPDAVQTMIVTPPEGDSYPVVTYLNGDIVTWPLAGGDVSVAGDGEIQLTFTKGSKVLRSYRGRTRIFPSIVGEADPPEPWTDWMTQFIAMKDAAAVAQHAAETAQASAEAAQGAAEDAADEAEAWANGGQTGMDPGPYNNAYYYSEQSANYANMAMGSASEASAEALKAEGYAVGKQDGVDVSSGSPYYHNNADYYADQAASSATAAALSKTGADNAKLAAQTAQGKAEDAQTAAETAQGKAEDAQEAAETAQGKAEDAQEAAETAEDNAQAWAEGTDDTTHPAYQNSAKDWAEAAETALSSKADKVEPYTADGHFAGLDAYGNLADSGKKPDDFILATSIAIDFDDLNYPVAAGTYATYAGKIYKAIQTVSSASDTGSAYWEEVTAGEELAGKADKVASATNGNFAALDSNGNLTDSGKKASDFAVPSDIPDVSGKADKADTVLSTTLSRGRKVNTTVGTGSVAFGTSVTASGNYSKATGNGTTASGIESTAEGYQTTASAQNAHAEGYKTTASGVASHAEGTGTVANHANQKTFGKYNVEDPSTDPAMTAGNYIEIVGNGSSSTHSNARTLDWNGNERLKGDVYVGCNADSTGGSKLAKVSELPDVSGKADKVSSPTDGDFAGIDVYGNLTDSGKKPSDFPLATSVAVDFDDLNFPVAAGTLTTYAGKIYKAVQTVPTSSDTGPTYWQEATVAGELTLIKSAITSKQESTSSSISAYSVGELFWYNGTLHVATSAIAIGDTIVDTGTGANCKDTTISEAMIRDIQINGSSILNNGVANVPVASTSGFGVVQIPLSTNYRGIKINSSGVLEIDAASDSLVKNALASYSPIVPYRQHLAAFYGLAKAAGADMSSISSVTIGIYPEAQKSAISDMLNAPVTISGSTPSITAKPGVRYICGEVSTLTIVVPATGIIDVVFESGSTATVLTVTPPSGVTAIKWANGFDPSSLDANTTYEINIMDGEYGVVGSWT